MLKVIESLGHCLVEQSLLGTCDVDYESQVNHAPCLDTFPDPAFHCGLHILWGIETYRAKRPKCTCGFKRPVVGNRPKLIMGKLLLCGCSLGQSHIWFRGMKYHRRPPMEATKLGNFPTWESGSWTWCFGLWPKTSSHQIYWSKKFKSPKENSCDQAN